MLKVSLKDIQQARERIKDTIKSTSLDKSLSATKLLGSEIFFKLENEQITGSFKIRGALNKLASLSQAEKDQGVIAASAGNHAQGVALSAAKAQVQATIVMPEAAPLIKVDATRGYGAEVILKGDYYDQAYGHAVELAQKKNLVFIHPYEDEKIVAGQGTIGLEIYEKIPDVDTVVVAIGGGGLISGIATAIKALNPKCKIIGVQSDLAPGMCQMFHKQQLADSPKRIPTIADGIAVKKPSRQMYESFIANVVDEIVTVNDEEISEAIVFLLERAKTVAEGSGAAPLAAAISGKVQLGKKTCFVIGGGNIDLNMVSKIIDQGLVRKGRLVELSVVGQDIPGFLNLVTSVLAAEKANVLQVHHDRASKGLHLREARIDFVLETTSHEHVEKIKLALAVKGILVV